MMEDEETLLLRENDSCCRNIVSSGRFGTRHLQIFLMFLGMMIAYALRVILSVAVVAMTKPETANPDFKVSAAIHLNGKAKVISRLFYRCLVLCNPLCVYVLFLMRDDEEFPVSYL